MTVVRRFILPILLDSDLELPVSRNRVFFSFLRLCTYKLGVRAIPCFHVQSSEMTLARDQLTALIQV